MISSAFKTDAVAAISRSCNSGIVLFLNADRTISESNDWMAKLLFLRVNSITAVIEVSIRFFFKQIAYFH